MVDIIYLKILPVMRSRVSTKIWLHVRHVLAPVLLSPKQILEVTAVRGAIEHAREQRLLEVRYYARCTSLGQSGRKMLGDRRVWEFHNVANVTKGSRRYPFDDGRFGVPSRALLGDKWCNRSQSFVIFLIANDSRCSTNDGELLTKRSVLEP